MKNKNHNLLIQPIGDIKQNILKIIKSSLNRIFEDYDFNFIINEDKMELISEEYNPLREQYNASLIIKRLKRKTEESEALRVLGIIDRDIYSNGLNFIFGIANLPHFQEFEKKNRALISITRLKPEFYGNFSHKSKFYERIIKEAIHELGHTFGLDHCKNFCIMRFSNTISQTDEKPFEFCDDCSKKLNSVNKSILN